MTMLQVPVVDLQPFYSGDPAARKRVAAEMDQVCRDIGFLVVTGHPIQTELMKAVADVSLNFFSLPEAEKLKLKSPLEGTAGLRGYSPMMDESLSHSIGVKAPGDIKEKFTRQFLFEEWSDENSVTFGTADTETRFKDNQSST